MRIPKKTSFFSLIWVFSLSVGAVAADTKADEPKILRNGKDVTVQMNENVQGALRAWNPKAKILQIENFSDDVWKLYTPKDPQSLPMTAMGDFNGDGKRDVGLLVTFNNRLKAIAVVSTKSGYQVHEIRTFSLNNRTLFALDKKKILSNVYLFVESASKLKHKSKLAKRDGLQVEILNSADTRLFYIKKGQPKEYRGMVN